MDDPVRRAAAIVPVLRDHAAWGDEHRRLHDESLAALTDAGIPRLRVPGRHGGHEADLTTVVRVIAELARGDGSAAWTAAVWAISAWMVGLFPERVRAEIFARPDVRVTGILSPTAGAAPVPGGVLVNGKWAFTTGAPQSHWNTNAAMSPDGPVLIAVPTAELEIVDDWHTPGLRATASVTTVARDVFVPDERVLRIAPLLEDRSHVPSRMFRAPFLATACAKVSAPGVGLARAAVEACRDVSDPRVAEAARHADEAEFHTRRTASLVDGKAARNEPWTDEERARVRLDLGTACRRAEEAVDILGETGHERIGRIRRDVHALSLHAALHPHTNPELFLGFA